MSDSTPQSDFAAPILEDGRRTKRIYWVFSIIFACLLIPPGVSIVVREPHDLNSWLMLVFFAAVCALPLAMPAGYALLNRKFGPTRFKPAAPGAIGGQLAGSIITGRPVRFDSDIRLSLGCFDRKRHTFVGRTSIDESTRWHDHYFLSHQLGADAGSTAIPVHFNIPSDCHPTQRISADEHIVWRLSADSTSGSSRFHAEFTVPVGDTPQGPPLADAGAAYRVPAPAPSTALARGITVGESAGDELDISFAAMRQPVVAIEHIFFAGLFIAAPIFLGRMQYVGHTAAIVFAIFFGLIALAIIPTPFRLCFGSSRVTIRFKTLELTRRWLFVSTARRFESPEITSVGTTMTLSGPHSEQLYALRFKSRKGSYFVIADALSRHDADQLALRIRKAMGLPMTQRPRSHAASHP